MREEIVDGKRYPRYQNTTNKNKKDCICQTYTRINTYYLYLLLTYSIIPFIVSISGFFVALKYLFPIINPMFSKVICIDFLRKIIIIYQFI